MTSDGKIQSGTLELMTEEQTKVYNQFIKEMAPELLIFPEVNTKWSLLRFLRARNFHLIKTKEMFRNYLKFRAKHNYQSIMSQPVSNFQVILDNYACGYCYSDNSGQLIAIEEVAKSNPEAIFKSITEDQLMHFLIQKYERMMYVVMPILSKIHKKRVDRTCLIIDLKGVGTSTFFNKELRNFLNICAKMGQDYYPEVLGKCFIINAPMLFKGIWSIVSTMLDERTVNKFIMESGNGLETMKKHLDIDLLPVSLGGKNDAKLNELNGPWKKELEESYEDLSFYLRDRSPHYEYYYTSEDKKEPELIESSYMKKLSILEKSLYEEETLKIHALKMPKSMLNLEESHSIPPVRVASFKVEKLTNNK